MSAVKGIFYHGTRRSFSEIEKFTSFYCPDKKSAVYLTTDFNEAREYAEDVDGSWDEKSRVLAVWVDANDEYRAKEYSSGRLGKEIRVYDTTCMEIVCELRSREFYPDGQCLDKLIRNDELSIAQNLIKKTEFYHGTNTDFSEFSTQFALSNNGATNSQLGIFMASEKGVGGRFGKNLLTVQEKSQNVLPVSIKQFAKWHEQGKEAGLHSESYEEGEFLEREFFNHLKVSLMSKGIEAIDIYEKDGTCSVRISFLAKNVLILKKENSLKERIAMNISNSK